MKIKIKPHPIHTNYKIYSNGKVFSLFSNKFLKTPIDKDGYLKVTVFTNEKRYYTTVHRLVAQTFLPNKDLTLQINHIDGNKQNKV